MQTPAHNALIRCRGADQVLAPSLQVLNPSEIAQGGSRPTAGRAKPSSWCSCTAEDGTTMLLPPIPGSPRDPAVVFRGALAGEPGGQSALSTSPLPRVPFSR